MINRFSNYLILGFYIILVIVTILIMKIFDKEFEKSKYHKYKKFLLPPMLVVSFFIGYILAKLSYNSYKTIRR